MLIEYLGKVYHLSDGNIYMFQSMYGIHIFRKSLERLSCTDGFGIHCECVIFYPDSIMVLDVKNTRWYLPVIKDRLQCDFSTNMNVIENENLNPHPNGQNKGNW